MIMSQVFWVQLARHGLDRVQLHTGAVVADLRDACKEKWSNTLRHVDAASITVYKSKEVFDNGAQASLGIWVSI